MKPLVVGAYGTAPWGNSPWGGHINKTLQGEWDNSPWGDSPWGGRAIPITAGGFGDEPWGTAPWGGLTYDDFLNSPSRKPVTKIVLELDFCTRSFGEQPCVGTGTPCYNTYKTCRDKANYVIMPKEYTFVTGGSLPFKTGERPYIMPSGVTYIPTEITDNLTVGGRVKAVLADEPDGDIGVDPYLSQRASVQGTFWKKLFARNPYYELRRASVYEGFEGLAESGYQLRFVGTLANKQDSNGQVSIEFVDMLQTLSNINLPAQIDIQLVNEIDAVQTELTVNSIEGLSAADGYVKLGDEILHYTGINAYMHTLSGVTRGALGTVASVATANAKLSLVEYLPLMNLFDRILWLMRERGGIAEDDILLDQFAFWKDMPGGEPNVSALLVDQVDLGTLIYELADLADSKIWQNEAQKITIRRNLPNLPGRSTVHLQDGVNIIAKSMKVDDNPDSRLSRAYVFWDRRALKQASSDQQYMRRDIAVDAEAESDNAYRTAKEKFYSCRWFSLMDQQEEVVVDYLHGLVVRRVWRQKDPLPILSFDVGWKDNGVLTGDFVRISTGAVQDIYGNPIARGLFEIVKREPKNRTCTLNALRICPRKVAFWAPEGHPDYASASEADKEYGYFADEKGLLNNEEAYCFW